MNDGIRVISCILVWILTGCGDDGPVPNGSAVLEVWAHAGQESERRVLLDQVDRFNAGQHGLRVHLTQIPEGSYNAQVQAAAVAGNLPDLLEFDGPFVYLYAWQGNLRTLDKLLPKNLQADLLPSIITQGRYYNRLWAVGTYDSGLCLYADRARLEHAGIRISTLERPWSGDEFGRILERLAQDDPDGQVLDLKLNYPGEWYTYAIVPLLRSAGGGLLGRGENAKAAGVLNGAASFEVLRSVQRWIDAGRVDPNLDDGAFVSGRVPLAFGGHWNHARYRERYRDELLLLPLPDFGQGPKTGQGSWVWAITTDSPQPEAAAKFLTFLLQTKQILAISQANGAVPATRSAIAGSPLYRAGGPLHLFVRQLEDGYAVPRPRTPAYPVITSEFQKAFDRIRSGGNVQAALDRAARAIDNEIDDNRSYPLVGPAREEVLQ